MNLVLHCKSVEILPYVPVVQGTSEELELHLKGVDENDLQDRDVMEAIDVDGFVNYHGLELAEDE